MFFPPTHYYCCKTESVQTDFSLNFSDMGVFLFRWDIPTLYRSSVPSALKALRTFIIQISAFPQIIKIFSQISVRAVKISEATSSIKIFLKIYLCYGPGGKLLSGSKWHLVIYSRLCYYCLV